MASTLPCLRTDLDFMPSPVPERPGLLIRDPHQYSDATLIIPPALVDVLQLFDGQSTELDLRAALVQLTGDLRVGELQQHLMESLSQAGFLDNKVYGGLREARHREFAESPVREAAHSGSAYPADPEALQRTIREYLAGGAAGARARDGLIGIAAPHVSPHGGRECYRAAYTALVPDYQDRIFAILGTSHYGQPDRFGLTRKAYRTPLGEARTEAAAVDWLASQAPDAILMEDYCHATEHSIEFQLVFLQHAYGPGIRILPILCGSFGKSLFEGGLPERDEAVKRFLGALGELAARDSDRLVWVLGVDMAHIGRRYGDPFPAVAERGVMEEVAERDSQRIEKISLGDAQGFWELVLENRDDLKWCGAAPLYTFLRSVPGARGQLIRYQQWNIDPQSVVTFAGMAFYEAANVAGRPGSTGTANPDSLAFST